MYCHSKYVFENNFKKIGPAKWAKIELQDSIYMRYIERHTVRKTKLDKSI